MANKMTVAHIAAEKQFPHFTLYRPKQNGGFEYDFVKLTAFFISRGYFIYRTSVNRFVPIRIIDNIVKEVGKKDLKDEILNFLTNIDECPEYIHQFALKDISKAVSDDFLETLPEKQVEFRRDKKDAIQLYYQNCIVKITKNKISTHPYTELNGFIWESQILPRSFERQDVDGEADFARFIFNLSKHTEARANSICTAFGFYLHNYKSSAYCPAIILNDEVISDHPEGGTGKGIFFKAVSKFVKMLKIDGKTFSFDKSFLYQRVTADTKIIFFDDVKKNFDFERLFSVITEGISTERKGKDELYIEFHDSPKVGLSTNYALRGTGNSHDRRKNELEISQYYNKNFTPEKEFGRMMFDDWNDADWVQFDNYMIQCCQLYLASGLIEQELVNLPEKRLMAETNSDFLKFMADFDFDTISKSELYSNFIGEFDEYAGHKYFTKQLFSKWVAVYADNKGYRVEDYVYMSSRHYKFTKK
jgi:hypothetical protein